MNRKKSIFMRDRRESVRKLSSRLNKMKDVVDEAVSLDAIKQVEYLNELEKLKFNKYDIIQSTALPIKCRQQSMIVRKELPDTEKGLIKRERAVLKSKVFKPDEPLDFCLFSSLNKNHFETGLQKPFVLQDIEYNKKVEEEYLVDEINTKNTDFDKSYSALANWQKHMRTRRNLSNSLSQRLQNTSESLLMNLQNDTALRQTNNNRIMDIIFPYIRKGGGAALTRSVFPEYEKTKTDLSLHRKAWKQELISNKEFIGYSNPIKSELQFSRSEGSIAPVEVQLQKEKELDVLNMLDYRDIDYSGLFVGPYRAEKLNTNITHDEQTVSATCQPTNDQENSPGSFCDESYQLQPKLRINDSDVFERSQSDVGDNSINSCYMEVPGKSKLPGLGVIYQVAFPLCHVNQSRVVLLKFDNIGSCTLKLSWKKIFHSKTYLQDTRRRSFYLDIREEHLISNSSTTKAVTFKSGKSGFWDEIWEVMIGPMLYPTKILFHFRAIALDPDYNSKSRTLILKERSEFYQYNLCKTIIDDIIKYVLNKEPAEKEEEPDIETDEMKFLRFNEQTCYNYDIIEDIKTFSTENLDIPWNLSLKCIKQHIIQDLDDSVVINDNLEQLMNLSTYIDTSPDYPVPKNNDYFRTWNDREDICRSLIMNALDSTETLLDNLSSKLKLGNVYKKETEDFQTKPADVQPTATLKLPTERKRRRSRKSIDRTVELVVERKPSVIIDMKKQKEIFHSKAEQFVFIIMQKLTNDIEHILKD